MYNEIVEYLKSLGDENRVKIVDMLSCKDFTNKEMLVYLDISQPTLSHHLKILTDSKIVNKKRNKNSYIYSLNIELMNKMSNDINKLCMCKDTCKCMEMRSDVQ